MLIVCTHNAELKIISTTFFKGFCGLTLPHDFLPAYPVRCTCPDLPSFGLESFVVLKAFARFLPSFDRAIATPGYTQSYGKRKFKILDSHACIGHG